MNPMFSYALWLLGTWFRSFYAVPRVIARNARQTKAVAEAAVWRSLLAELDAQLVCLRGQLETEIPWWANSRNAASSEPAQVHNWGPAIRAERALFSALCYMHDTAIESKIAATSDAWRVINLLRCALDLPHVAPVDSPTVITFLIPAEMVARFTTEAPN